MSRRQCAHDMRLRFQSVLFHCTIVLPAALVPSNAARKLAASEPTEVCPQGWVEACIEQNNTDFRCPSGEAMVTPAVNDGRIILGGPQCTHDADLDVVDQVKLTT